MRVPTVSAKVWIVVSILLWAALAVFMAYCTILNLREGNNLRAALGILSTSWAIRGFMRSGEDE